MKKGLYAGSFDPITNGHMDIIERGARLVDELVIGIMCNPSKTPMFSTDERRKIIESCVSHIPNVKVIVFYGLMADLVRTNEIDVVIRGLRVSMDYEYESTMAHVNNRYFKNTETIFLMSRLDYSIVSSSVVKELHFFGGDIKDLVPLPVLEAMNRKKLENSNK